MAEPLEHLRTLRMLVCHIGDLGVLPVGENEALRHSHSKSVEVVHGFRVGKHSATYANQAWERMSAFLKANIA